MTAAFDVHAESYEEIVEQSVAFAGLGHDFFLTAKHDMLTRIIRERLPHTPKPAVLDIGCGVGRAHPLLRTLAGTFSGTDPSAESIARAGIDNPGIDYRIGDGERLPYETDSFDLAVAICVLHHVAPDGWPGFVAEMRRVVRPGGAVVLIEHNPWHPLTRLAVARCPFDADAVLLSHRKALKLLRGSDVSEPKAEHFLFLPFRTAIGRVIERALVRLPVGAQYAAVGSA